MDPRVVDEDPSHIELSTPLSELHKLYMVINLLQRILDNLRRSPRPSGIAEIKEFAYKVRVCRKVLTFVKKSFMTLHYWTFILDIVRNFGPVARPRSIITLYAENREEEPKMLMSVNNGKLVFSYAPPKDKAKKVSYCKYCAGEHKITKCMVFNIISVDRRLSWAANNNICFKCCKPRHRSRVCRGKGCEVEGCGQPHHTLLHTEHSYQFTTLISATKKQ